MYINVRSLLITCLVYFPHRMTLCVKLSWQSRDESESTTS